MKATLTITESNDSAKIRQNRKENHFVHEYSAINTALEKIVSLRIYATNSTHYACIWVHGDKYTSGGGKAGGYGYHRASQAAMIAIDNAGIQLSEQIGGRGESAIRDAVLAIAKAASNNKRRKIAVFEAHA